MTVNRLLRLLGAMALTSAALAQPAPRSYAVISEIAREVSVVGFQEATGTRIDPNLRQRIPIPGGALDKVALVSSQLALKSAAPGASVWLIAPADTDFFDGLQTAAVGDRVAVPDDLAAAFKENRSTHLLLFTRHKAAAQFRFANLSDGEGPLEGLGFYVDRRLKVENRDTSQSGVGYLAPFAHFRATLIDTATTKVIKTETVRASQVLGAGQAQNGSVNPWDALTSAQKINKLRDMVRDEVTRLVPLLVATP